MQDVGASGGRHPPSLLEVMVAETWELGADRMLLPHDWEELGALGEKQELGLLTPPAVPCTLTHCSPFPGMNQFSSA